MNIISKRTLVQFYEKHPQAKTPLEVWHQDVKKVEWKTPDDIKKVIYDVLSHRLILTYDAKVKGVVIQDVIKSILKEVKEPKIKI